MHLTNVLLIFWGILLYDFDIFGISAQNVEVVSPSSMIYTEKSEVTCTFSGTLISIEWRKTQEEAPNSDNGDELLTYILNGEVTGPGKSRDMDISLSNYSLIIDSVMLQDSGVFWCKVSIGGIGIHENFDSTIVYNAAAEPIITATECEAGIDADFCVTEGEPITCKVFELKPLDEDDIELTIDGEGIQGSQSQESYEVEEDGVSYTFYNVERTLTTGSAAAEAYTYNCKINTTAFEADAPPVKVLVSKVAREKYTTGEKWGIGIGVVCGCVLITSGAAFGLKQYKDKK